MNLKEIDKMIDARERLIKSTNKLKVDIESEKELKNIDKKNLMKEQRVKSFAFLLGIFIVFAIMFFIISSISNFFKSNKQQKYKVGECIKSNDYVEYIIDTLKKINNNDEVFNIFSYNERFQYIEIRIQSKNRLTYEEYDIQSKNLTAKLYEEIKDKTIEKDGPLSYGSYIINLIFYEEFNDNIISKNKTTLQVGLYQIHTEDLEKYREYDKCVNGGISDLEWNQEIK